MFEQIASQVRSLKSHLPLREFKPSSVKVACLGNCVVNKISSRLAREDDVDSVFCSNLDNWGNHHAESFFERAEEADLVVVLQTSSNANLLDTTEIGQRFKGKCFFVPLVWVEGLDTLQMFSVRGATKFFGGENVAASIREHGAGATAQAISRGKLTTDPAIRLAESLARLRELEQTSIKISDVIEGAYREQRVMNAVGHPAGLVVRELYVRLTQKMGVVVNNQNLDTPLAMSMMTLPDTPRVFSPYDVEELGMRYPHDPDWMLAVKSLTLIMAAQIKNESYGLSVEDIA